MVLERSKLVQDAGSLCAGTLAGRIVYRRFLSVLGLFCSISLQFGVLQAAQIESFEVKNLGACGLVTRYASTEISDNCLQEARNVYLDEDVGITRRTGFSRFNATALAGLRSVRGMWHFRATDGTDYLVVLSSQTMHQSSGGAFTAIAGLSSRSLTAEMDCTQVLGRLWCVNGVDTMFSWDGTSTATISGAPLGNLIDNFRNRVVASNVSGNQSRLYLSGELDGTDYTIPVAPVSTSPAILAIGGVNDGNNMRCLMGTYQDVLLMGKLNSLFGLYGFDRRDFVVREISREVGCLENKSIQEKQGGLYWLSIRGVEKMSGPSIFRVSDPIRDDIDEIIRASGNSRNVTDTSQSDFELGNLVASGIGSPINAVISPGSLVVSSWSRIDTSSFNFVDGTFTNVSTTSVIGSLVFEQGALSAFINAGAESNNRTTNWESNPTFAPTANTSMFGSYRWEDNKTSCGQATDNFVVKIRDVDGNTILERRAAITDGYDETFTINTATITGSLITLRISREASPIESVAISTYFIRGVAIAFRVLDIGDAGDCKIAWDINESNLITTGTFVSATFNTGLSTPTFGRFDVSLTSNATGAVVFETRTATSPSGNFSAYQTATPGSAISSPARQYIQYRASFTVTAATVTPAEIQSLTLIARTTGYFVSQCRNPDSSITSWGLFQCNVNRNGGDFTFYISTGSSCNAVTSTAAFWNTQNNNAAITAPTATFVAYRSFFDLDIGSETPTLQDCTINWNEGTSRPPVATAVYKDRYYFAYTTVTLTTPANDSILVLDSRDQWALHDAPDCYSMVIYNRGLYCGSSAADGRVHRMDVGNDDDGAALTARIRTKDFDFGNPYQKKNLKSIKFNLSARTDATYSISLTPKYYIDTSTDSYTLGAIDLGEDYGRFIAAKVPARLDNNVTGRWFSFELQSSGTQGPWKLFAMRFSFNRLRED